MEKMEKTEKDQEKKDSSRYVRHQDERAHHVVLVKGEREEIRRVVCAHCGYELAEAQEYHPSVFCLLKHNGTDPWEFIAEAERRRPHERMRKMAPPPWRGDGTT